MIRRLSATLTVVALAAASLLLLASPASAACHIAAFVETEVEGNESTGVVSLVVELQGRVGSCAGTVDVATVDGTAVAGEDYEAVTRTLTFEENDDRVETVDITILADGEAEESEQFMVELSNPTGSISATGGPATVVIVADGGGDAATEDDGTATEAAEPTTSDGDAAGAEDEGGGSLGIIIAVIAAVVIGGAAFTLLRGRGG